jgi:hypothetical protein
MAQYKFSDKASLGDTYKANPTKLSEGGMETAVITATDRIVVPIVGTFVVLWIVGWIVFYRGKNGQLKRWLWPRYLAGAAVLFGFSVLVTVVASRSGWAILCLIIFMPALIGLLYFTYYYNSRMVVFCNNCGHFNYPYWFTKSKNCLNCGVSLDDKKTK